jgi:hypothetical protein
MWLFYLRTLGIIQRPPSPLAPPLFCVLIVRYLIKHLLDRKEAENNHGSVVPREGHRRPASNIIVDDTIAAVGGGCSRVGGGGKRRRRGRDDVDVVIFVVVVVADVAEDTS